VDHRGLHPIDPAARAVEQPRTLRSAGQTSRGSPVATFRNENGTAYQTAYGPVLAQPLRHVRRRTVRPLQAITHGYQPSMAWKRSGPVACCGRPLLGLKSNVANAIRSIRRHAGRRR
jgi:hypothetical protein